MKRAWDKLHNFEQKEKKVFLKKLNTQEALGIFKDLYQLSAKPTGRLSIIAHSQKTKILINIHSTFNRIKR